MGQLARHIEKMIEKEVATQLAAKSSIISKGEDSGNGVATITQINDDGTVNAKLNGRIYENLVCSTAVGVGSNVIMKAGKRVD